MAVNDLALKGDEFAFHFDTSNGIDARKLGVFLQRAAKIARDNGAHMKVVGLQDGSLDVIVRVAKAVRSRIAVEFDANPVKTSAAGTVLVGVVVKAIAHMMAPEASGATPISKAGAEIVEKERVKSITIITHYDHIVVMNPIIAGEVRRAERRRQMPAISDYREAQRLISDGGELTGTVGEMDGDLYFRPDGHRFAVPIDINDSAAADGLFPGARFCVRGELILRRERPYALIVSEAVLI